MRDRIVATPATTFDGILLKLVVARWCNRDDFATQLAERARDHGPTDETMVYAAVTDLIAVVDGLYGRRAA